MSIEKSLRGQPFIGKEDSDGHPRECRNCFFGIREANNPIGLEPTGECETTAPRELFKETPLPPVLDGLKVGNYCPHFSDYSEHEDI